MKIPNPWPHHALSRCTCETPNGVVISTGSSRGPIEVPDDSVQVLIEPVKATGRGGRVEVLGQGRVWSKEWGLLDIEDHLRKIRLANEEAEMKVERAKAKARRPQLQDKPVPVAKPKPEPALLDEKVFSEMSLEDSMDKEEKCDGGILLDDPRNK